MALFAPLRFDDEGVATETSRAQAECEDGCIPWLSLATLPPPSPSAVAAGTSLDDRSPVAPLLDAWRRPFLARHLHIRFLMRCLDAAMSPSYTSLDAARAWMVYWTLHALDLLDVRPVGYFDRIVRFLSQCRWPAVAAAAHTAADGADASTSAGGGAGSGTPVRGFCGGPQQGPHVASTYAAVLALLIVGTPEAYAAIDREGLHAFYMSCKDAGPPGCGSGFRVEPSGELDVRGCYTALAVADLVNVLTPTLREGLADYLAACQTYEGGFGGEPGNEAHGGYAFCAMAGLTILGELRAPRVDVAALQRWLSARQLALEGGFSGRSNKLVDGCYTFWQGACFAMLPATPAGGPAVRSVDVAGGSWLDRVPSSAASSGSEAVAPSGSTWVDWEELHERGDRDVRLSEGELPAPATVPVPVPVADVSESGSLSAADAAPSSAVAGSGSAPAAAPPLLRRVTLEASDAAAASAAPPSTTATHGLFPRIVSSKFGGSGTADAAAAKSHRTVPHSIRRMLRQAQRAAEGKRRAAPAADAADAGGGDDTASTSDDGASSDGDEGAHLHAAMAVVDITPPHATLAAVAGLHDDALFHRRKLQQYVLLCSQQLEGGLRDKPSKSRDYYHTCYCLSGLSLAQHDASGRYDPTWLVGHPANNLIAPVHPVYNIRYERVAAARRYFAGKPVIGSG